MWDYRRQEFMNSCYYLSLSLYFRILSIPQIIRQLVKKEISYKERGWSTFGTITCSSPGILLATWEKPRKPRKGVPVTRTKFWRGRSPRVLIALPRCSLWSSGSRLLALQAYMKVVLLKLVIGNSNNNNDLLLLFLPILLNRWAETAQSVIRLRAVNARDRESILATGRQELLLHAFRFPSRCSWSLLSSWLLRGFDWSFLTDVFVDRILLGHLHS